MRSLEAGQEGRKAGDSAIGLAQIEARMEEICRLILAGMERQREVTSLMQETLRTTRERPMLGDG